MAPMDLDIINYRLSFWKLTRAAQNRDLLWTLAMLPLPLEARKSARAEIEVEAKVEVNIAAMMLSHLLQRAT